MRKILLSTRNEEENRIAVVENGRLTDYLSVLSGQEDRRGTILCGIITEIEPSLEACFVDVGDARKGFLQFNDIHEDCLLPGKGGSVADRLEKGQPILVQVTKDAREKKGQLLTTRIKMNSNHLLLMTREKDPDGLKVSRKANETERDRLMEAKEKLDPGRDMSLIVRSNGLDMGVDALVWEKAGLLSLWDLIRKVFAKQQSPMVIYAYRNIVNICLTEYVTRDTDEIVCDQEETEQEVRSLLEQVGTGLDDRVRTAGADEALFPEAVLGQTDALVSRRVQLPSGGEIVIDITEALVAIDVNSSRSRGQRGIENTAFSTNMEAAAEIATQLRLRNLSGQIVIDFIDMESHQNREKLEQAFRRAVRADRAQITVGGLSQFGLLEMTRQYVGRSMHDTHTLRCANCDGTGRTPTVRAFAVSMLDRIQDTCLNRRQVGTIYAELSTEVATYLLNERREDLARFQSDFGARIVILPSSTVRGFDHRFRIEKHRRPDGDRPSFEQYKLDDITRDTYIDDEGAGRRKMPAAITGVVKSGTKAGAAKAKARGKAKPEADLPDPSVPEPGRPAFSLGRFLQSFFSGSEQVGDGTPGAAEAAPGRQEQEGRQARPAAKPEGAAKKRRPRSRSRKRKPDARREGEDRQEGKAESARGEGEGKASDKPAKRRRGKPGGDRAKQERRPRPAAAGSEPGGEGEAKADAGPAEAAPAGQSGDGGGKREQPPAPVPREAEGDAPAPAAAAKPKEDAKRPEKEADSRPPPEAAKADPPAPAPRPGPGSEAEGSADGGNDKAPSAQKEGGGQAPAAQAGDAGGKGEGGGTGPDAPAAEEAAQQMARRRDRGNTVRKSTPR